MTFVGEVRNGSIVVKGGLPLPEGTVVQIQPIDPQQESALAKLAKMAVKTDLPPDYAAQHEHYVKGTPRK